MTDGRDAQSTQFIAPHGNDLATLYFRKKMNKINTIKADIMEDDLIRHYNVRLKIYSISYEF